MKKLKDCNVLLALLFSVMFYGQNSVNGVVLFLKTNKPISNIEIYDKASGLLTITDNLGNFEFETSKEDLSLVFFSVDYEIKEVTINSKTSKDLKIVMQESTTQLSQVVVNALKRRAFELRKLNDVEETSIYAGKKTEVVLVDQSMANLASNNARQIYSQVAGLNIFENDDAGLQLNIGGRGLDPNRTSNFNTRQNGYDISADVLGYPESYYAPAAEGLKEIQVIRGAASLQYGTQFGGLINFKMKSPNPDKPLELISRNTLGSFNLYTNFTSFSGTQNKLSYYTYFNYKKGDGFRPNSEFESKNVFTHLGYQFNKKTALEGEVTYLNYLAKQAGGLTDEMFNDNPYQSNRERNWFRVNWSLYNLKFSHQFRENTNFTFNIFGLNAYRKALGFRIRRVDLPDTGEARELLVSDFKNFGFEGRLLTKYNLFGKKAIYLVGTKYYKANNADFQGPGTNGSNPNFSSALTEFPNYRIQSNFKNPNENIAVFGENIVYLSDKISITPGIRFEYIKTESNGVSRRTNFNAANLPIGNQDIIVNDVKERAFMLLGVGFSYKLTTSVEFYGNISQNYRSITFSDVNIINPSNGVDSNLDDENGFTTDIGIRGNTKWLSFDVSAFGLFYNNRIGFLTAQIPPIGNLGQLRTNIGDARILGLESLLDFNVKRVFNMSNNFSLNYFINSSFLTSEYTRTLGNGIQGNKVEFIPDLNLKTGIRFGYKNLNASLQYTYLSEQFTDAQNSILSNESAIVGVIPEYDILDLSLSYAYKNLKLETGINNILNTNYFTRRATGYPGPGIIPSAPINWYTTFQIKL